MTCATTTVETKGNACAKLCSGIKIRKSMDAERNPDGVIFAVFICFCLILAASFSVLSRDV